MIIPITIVIIIITMITLYISNTSIPNIYTCIFFYLVYILALEDREYLQYYVQSLQKEEGVILHLINIVYIQLNRSYIIIFLFQKMHFSFPH